MMKENKTAATIEPLYFKEQVNNIEETMQLQFLHGEFKFVLSWYFLLDS